jgi:hypothetical protein
LVGVAVRAGSVVMVDPDDQGKVAGATGLNSREGVLEYDAPRRIDTEHARRLEETIGGGFAREVTFLHHGTVDDGVE